MLWHRQAIFELKGDKLSSSAGFEPGSLRHLFVSRLKFTECTLTNRLSYRGSSFKTWTLQPVPIISDLCPSDISFTLNNCPMNVNVRVFAISTIIVQWMSMRRSLLSLQSLSNGCQCKGLCYLYNHCPMNVNVRVFAISTIIVQWISMQRPLLSLKSLSNGCQCKSLCYLYSHALQLSTLLDQAPKNVRLMEYVPY